MPLSVQQIFGGDVINPASRSVNDIFGVPVAGKSTLFNSANDIVNTSQTLPKEPEVEEGGFINTLAEVINVPQQILYTIGKNIGEELSQKELGDEGFFEEIWNAARGKGKITLNDVLKTVGADFMDFKLPEGLTFDDPYVRIPVAIAAGIVVGASSFFGLPLLGAGAFAGSLVAFGSERFLSGEKGFVSSYGDVAFDPLNKLQLFQTPVGKEIAKDAGLATRILFPKGARQASQADSILRQVVKGDRNLFDLRGPMFSSNTSFMNKVSDYMFRPVEFIGENAAQILNNKVGNKLVDVVDVFTGGINTSVVQPLAKYVFVKNGHLTDDVQEIIKKYDDDVNKAQVAVDKLQYEIFAKEVNTEIRDADYLSMIRTSGSKQSLGGDTRMEGINKAYASRMRERNALSQQSERLHNKLGKVEMSSNEGREIIKDLTKTQNAIDAKDAEISAIISGKRDAMYGSVLNDDDWNLVASLAESGEMGDIVRANRDKYKQLEIELQTRPRGAASSLEERGSIMREVIQSAQTLHDKAKELRRAKAGVVDKATLSQIDDELKAIQARRDEMGKELQRLAATQKTVKANKVAKQKAEALLKQKEDAYDNIFKKAQSSKKEEDWAKVSEAFSEKQMAKRGLDTELERIARIEDSLVIKDPDILRQLGDMGVEQAGAVARGRITSTEARLTSKVLKGILPKEFTDKLDLYLADSAASVSQTNPINRQVVEMLSYLDNAGPKEQLRFAVKMHTQATYRDLIRTVGEAAYESLGDKGELVTLMQKMRPGLDATDTAKIKMFFMDNFLDTALHVTRKNDAQHAGFFGRVIDGVRGFLRTVWDRFFDKEAFQNKKLYDELGKFVKNADYFPQKGMQVVTNFNELANKDEFLDLLLKQHAELEACGMLPPGLSWKVSTHGIARYIIDDGDRIALDRVKKDIVEFGLLNNNPELVRTRVNIGTPALDNLKRTVDNALQAEEVLLKYDVLSKGEIDALKSARNLNYFQDKGSPAYEALAKLHDFFEIIPVENFVEDPVLLTKHFMKNAKSIAASRVVKSLSSYFVKDKDELVKGVKATMLNQLDGVFLDVQKNEDIARFLKKAQSKIPSGEPRKAYEAFFNQMLSKKPTHSLAKYMMLPEHFEKFAPYLDEETLIAIRSYLPVVDQRGITDLEELAQAGTIPFVQPTLVKAAAQKRLLNLEKIKTKTGGVAFKTTRNVSDLDELLTSADLLDDFYGAGGKKNSSFEDIMQSKLFKEGQRGTRGFTELPGEGLPLNEQYLKLGRIEDTRQLGDMQDNWKRYSPRDSKGRPAKLPPLLDAMRGAWVPKDIHRVLVGRKFEDLPAAWANLRKLFRPVIEGLQASEAESIVSSGADRFEQIFKVKVSGGLRESASRALQGANYDYLTQLFKSQALLSGGFHVRNFVSGFAVNLMHGVSAKTQVEAFKELIGSKKARSKTLQAYIDQGGLSPNIRRVGGAAGDIELQDTLGIATNYNPLSTSFKGYQINWRMGGYVEDVLRYGSFKHAVEELGKSFDEAADYVKLLHFDYADLSAVEKKVLKRLMPFYTYTRKAIARDSRLFMERTGNYVKMGHIIGMIEDQVETGETTDSIPFWISERMGVPFRKNVNGQTEYFLLSEWIPAADLMSLYFGTDKDRAPVALRPLKNLLEKGAQSVNPFIKNSVEQALNYSFYFGKKLEDYEGELTDFFGFTVRARYVPLLQSIRLLNDLEKSVQAGFSIPNATNPNLDNPDKLSAMFNVAAGAKLIPNRDPQKTYFYNVVMPIRKLRSQLRQVIRSEGPQSPNVAILQGLIQEALKRQAEAAPPRKVTLPPPKASAPGTRAGDDALRRMFTTRRELPTK